MKFLARKVRTIFIMLGNSCNLNCVYCLQHPLVHHQIAKDINPEIYDFIRQVTEENDGNSVNLRFYGGEPLLYFNQIKEIVEHTKDISNIHYSIITNGKLIDDEIVKFFNDNKVSVAISWDGKNVLKTRKFNAFDSTKPLRRRIMRLNVLCVSGVISSEMYPIELLDSMQEIVDQYYALNGTNCFVNLDEVFDTGFEDSCRYIIDDLDLDRIYNEMEYLTNEYIDSLSNDKQTSERNVRNIYIGSLVNQVKYYIDHTDEVLGRSICNCGNGYSTLNMDLDGKLYPCHNTSEFIGTIKDDYFNYLAKVISLDNTKKRIDERCKHCPVLGICNGGCKLITDKVLDDTYCNFKKAMYYPVFKCLWEYGEKING